MISLDTPPRRAAVEDYYQISNLIFHEANIHRHLDWRTPLEWLGASNYWALEEYGHITAALACPEDPPQVAWIRFFGHQPQFAPREVWTKIWQTARAEIIRANPQTCVAAIATKMWFQNLLLASGFHLEQNIVMLQLTAERWRAPLAASHDFRIRLMQPADLPAVAALDFNAFGWFWHNTTETLQRAHAASVYATVIEDASGVVGYQISTGNSRHTHLARLAVAPQMQGRGVGGALVSDLVRYTGAWQVSVNTQQDNAASLALYKKMGFMRTGESFPVLVYQNSPG